MDNWNQDRSGSRRCGRRCRRGGIEGWCRILRGWGVGRRRPSGRCGLVSFWDGGSRVFGF